MHKVGSSPLHTHEKSAITCYQCGKTGHQSARCRHKGAKCHSCGKVGHLQAVCRSKPSQASEQPRSQQPHSVRQVKETGIHIYCSLYQIPVQGHGRPLWKRMEFLWKWRLILESQFHWWLKTRTGTTGHIGSCSSPS